MTNQEIFRQLQEKYTTEELADAVMVPEELTAEELTKASEELRAIRLQRLANQTEDQRLLSDVLRLKFQIEDILKKSVFIPEKSFSKFLEEYISILRRSKKQFAEDIGLHYTRLSRILNDREEPNIELAYRLEKHCDGLIQTEIWWKLSVMKQEYLIKKDLITRENEGNKVKNALKIQATAR